MPAVINNDLGHAQNQGAIRTRFELEMDIGIFFRGGGDTGIQNDELAVPLLESLDSSDSQVAGVVGAHGSAQHGVGAGRGL